jgi:hypothetical protein
MLRNVKKRKFTEATQVQIPLMQWAYYHPICRDYLFHIANERKCTPKQGSFLKKMGVKKDIPDIFLAHPCFTGARRGFFIELKAKGRKPTKSQFIMMEKLRNVGYHVDWFDNWENAKIAIEKYLDAM